MTNVEVKARIPWWQIVAVGRNPRWTLIRLVVLAILAVVAFKLTVIPIRVFGPSMIPAFKEGEAHFINRLSYRRRSPQRGDVVAIRMAGQHVLLLKRIVALPGERFAIRNGMVLINGEELEEPWVKEKRARWNYPRDEAERQLGEDEFLVIGDNRSMTQDLHYWGIVKQNRIVGRLWR